MDGGPHSQIYRIVNKATGLYLSGLVSSSLSVSVWTGPPEQYDVPSDALLWHKEFAYDRYWRFNHMYNTGYNLDSNAEQSIYLHDANAGSYQLWILDEDGEGYFTLQNLATSFMADSNAEGHAYTMQKNDGPYQRWRLLPVYAA
jgi:hypothetical protein